jgi:ketosteroid isomerase-like protein
MIFSLGADAQTESQTANPDAKILAEAQSFQKELVAALRKGDRAALERMIADDFVFIHSTGPLETKEEYIKNSAGGNLLIQRAEFEQLEEAWRLYEGNTAIRYARSVIRNRAINTENRLRHIGVYVKTAAKGWQWVSGQSTKLPVRPKAAADVKISDDYIGVYQINAERSFTVTKENGVLYGLTTGRLKSELIPVSNTAFVLFNENSDPGYVVVTFVRDSSGEASEVVMHLNGQEVWRAKKIK